MRLYPRFFLALFLLLLIYLYSFPIGFSYIALASWLLSVLAVRLYLCLYLCLFLSNPSPAHPLPPFFLHLEGAPPQRCLRPCRDRERERKRERERRLY